MNGMDYPIDFVVTWVDSSDPCWRADFEKYGGKPRNDDSARYRNWDLFRYWFRAVEKYAPWVHKVFLVTNGKTPDWINRECPKLACVSHSDFIPEKYLPTFNSNCIELNLGRIDGLSEHFVYFNDDTYVNSPVEPSYYFRKGLPCDFNYEKIPSPAKYDQINQFGIEIALFCNIAVLNKHFNRCETVRQAPWKWFGLHLGRHWFQSFLLSLYGSPRFNHFYIRHHEQPFLKSTFTEIWKKEPGFLDESCSRFRKNVTLTPYFVREWQLASNKFHPIWSGGKMKCIHIKPGNVNSIETRMFSDYVKSLCINDNPNCTDQLFEAAKIKIKSWFERKLPDKSLFEL